ncbi:hypothetical protein MOV61_08670 [Neorhizobium sp. BETTINA12A]|uniref:DUF6894 family protein n=1 Tax=Neorhizobium sp. BETTINA12A TaxID=2908924 RepID=UPI001FF630A7|nr:hypothetical protein [Neorhizobium sp. BETTINA12A]MCJ9750787.1 hypothetical protein [Neorhizobium sp. BETTINA12A]
MARYFFDLINGDGPVRDNEGQEISTRKEISREVSRILADIAREEFPERGKGAISIEVRNEHGQPVFTGRLSFQTQWHDEPEL